MESAISEKYVRLTMSYPIYSFLCYALYFLLPIVSSQVIDNGYETDHFDLPHHIIRADLPPRNDEQKLYRYLSYGYDRSVRPVFNSSKIVEVFIGLTLTHIFNIDEKNQVLALNVWVEQQWNDERMRWDPQNFGNISKMTLATRLVWTPDIVLFNNARDYNRGFLNTNLHASHDGEIQWAPPQKVHTRCHMDVSNFPFDHQFCSLIFRSWIYDISQVDLKIMERYDGKSPFTRDSYSENGEWEIVDNRTLRYEQETGGKRFGTVVFEIHLRRRMLYFLYNIIAPCVMLSVLTMMQFILPCESGEKVTLGLTVLLAYSVFSFNIAESMPETSEVIPLIAIYLMTIMGISALSVAFSVFVLSLRHGAENKIGIPKWLEFTGFRILGPILGRTQRRKTKSRRDRSNTDIRLDTSHDDILSSSLISRVQTEQNFEELVARWSHLSNIFDRFFFIIVFVLTSVCTVFLLIIAPNINPPRLHERSWKYN